MTNGTQRHASPPRFFEGTEKKFELVIDGNLPPLRSFGEEYWCGIADSCGAHVLSRISNESCDAYLLAESSLFVFDCKVVMITCGRTRLPDAVSELLRRVPPDLVRFFIYERKNELYPHRQPSSFHDDVRRLNDLLPGRAFQFGDEDDHHILLFHLDRSYETPEQDLTVEILMHGIDDAAGMGSETARVADGTSLLGDLLPGFRIDEHWFQPSGYSLNAIRGDHYWTAHVTPEEGGSYASFETNCPLAGELDAVAARLLERFNPRSFDLFVFHQGQEIGFEPERYRLKSHVAHELACGYEVRFMSFFRPPTGVRRPVELPVETMDGTS